MKAVSKFLTVAIISMFMAVNANAWGHKEQGILIGAGAALLLPGLLNPSNVYYNSRGYYGGNYNNRYYRDRYYLEPQVQYVRPQVTYVEAPKSEGKVVTISSPAPSHRQQKQHVHVNKINPNDTVVIEYSDGTKTIIEGK
ncbi:MAG: hypothetical protein LBG67_05580 [Campylobacteraceae bacterium]|jgi:hypothetical protein|nr:hypothetical protein [Campylobacteraceae bacterium]